MGKLNASFTGVISGIKNTGSEKYIDLEDSERFAYCKVSLNLKFYFIEKILCFSKSKDALITDQLYFTNDAVSQDEALDTLIDLLEVEENILNTDTEEEKSSVQSNIPGPKRVEIELISHKGAKEDLHLLVTTVIPPNDSFKYYTVGGRSKEKGETYFKSVIRNGINSDSWFVKKIGLFEGGCTSVIREYPIDSSHEQEKAWRSLLDFFNKMHSAEKKYLMQWNLPPLEIYSKKETPNTPNKKQPDYWDEYADYYGKNYYSPKIYEPMVADFRVRGDAIGKEIYSKIIENRKGGEEIVAFVEKKEEYEESSAVVTLSKKKPKNKNSTETEHGYLCKHAALVCGECHSVKKRKEIATALLCSGVLIGDKKTTIH